MNHRLFSLMERHDSLVTAVQQLQRHAAQMRADLPVANESQKVSVAF